MSDLDTRIVQLLYRNSSDLYRKIDDACREPETAGDGTERFLHAAVKQVYPDRQPPTGAVDLCELLQYGERAASFGAKLKRAAALWVNERTNVRAPAYLSFLRDQLRALLLSGATWGAVHWDVRASFELRWHWVSQGLAQDAKALRYIQISLRALGNEGRTTFVRDSLRLKRTRTAPRFSALSAEQQALAGKLADLASEIAERLRAFLKELEAMPDVVMARGNKLRREHVNLKRAELDVDRERAEIDAKQSDKRVRELLVKDIVARGSQQKRRRPTRTDRAENDRSV